MEKNVIKVVADVKDAHSGLNKLEGSISGLAKKNLTLNGVLSQGASVLTKFGTAFSAGAVAAKAFGAAMDNCQTFGDGVRNSLSALTDTAGTLMGALASADFSAFSDGLLNIANKAYEAAAAMDELWNVQQSHNFISQEQNLVYQSALTTLRDPNSTAEQKQKARADAELALAKMAESNEVLKERTWEAVKKKFAVKTNLQLKDISEASVLEALRAQGTREGRQLVADAKKAVHTNVPSELMPARGDYQGGPTPVVSIRDTNPNYEVEMEAWRYNNQDALIMNAANELFSDEDVKTLMDLVSNISAVGARQQQLRRTFNKAVGSAGKGPGGGSNKTKSEEAPGIAPIDQLTTATIGAIPSLDQLNVKLAEFKKAASSATTKETWDEAQRGIKDTQAAIDAHPLMMKFGVPTAELATMMQETLDGLQLPKITVDFDLNAEMGKKTKEIEEGAAKTSKDFKLAATAVSGLGTALGNVGNKGLNIAGTVMQAVANIALGFSKGSIQAAGGGPWAWIAATVSGLATMTATIASIKSATSGSFAEGGMVPGAYNGGLDNAYVYASPGEVILNRAQQSNLLGQLESGSRGGGDVEFRLRGEELIGVITNHQRRTGKKLRQ